MNLMIIIYLCIYIYLSYFHCNKANASIKGLMDGDACNLNGSHIPLTNTVRQSNNDVIN